jgi:hypothetical protein
MMAAFRDALTGNDWTANLASLKGRAVEEDQIIRADLMAGDAGILPSPHRRLRCGLGRKAQRCRDHRSVRGRRPLITTPLEVAA